MKKFLVYILSVYVPLLSGIALINYIVDPGHIYSRDQVDDIIEGARMGLNVVNVSDIDDRVYKKKLAELYHDRIFDYLVIGSSRSMTISEDCLNGASLLNLGVSGCKLEEMIAYYQICKENRISYKNVIIGTDPSLFNQNDGDERWKSIASEFYEYKGIDNGNATNEFKLTLIQNLFSPTYFRSSIIEIPKLKSSTMKLKYAKTYKNEGITKRTDGSIYYGKEYREKPQSWVDDDAATHWHGMFNRFDNFSEERCQIFEDLIASFRQDDVKIYFWCCPYHPVFYKRILKLKGMPVSIDYVYQYARDNGFKLIGAFNPNDIELTNKDFYDAFHLRKEVVDKLIIRGLGR